MDDIFETVGQISTDVAETAGDVAEAISDAIETAVDYVFGEDTVNVGGAEISQSKFDELYSAAVESGALKAGEINPDIVNEAIKGELISSLQPAKFNELFSAAVEGGILTPTELNQETINNAVFTMAVEKGSFEDLATISAVTPEPLPFDPTVGPTAQVETTPSQVASVDTVVQESLPFDPAVGPTAQVETTPSHIAFDPAVESNPNLVSHNTGAVGNLTSAPQGAIEFITNRVKA
jgi:hypothetical protein